MALLFFAQWVSAEPSMRRCMLLPMRDSLDGALAFKIFEIVETYLKDGDWCFYQSNSEILNIFSNYKKNLDSVLENKKVLKIVSEKTNAGSLIQVKIVNQIKGVDVKIKIFGANGEDIFFKREAKLKTDDYTLISQTIKSWLDIYKQNIPYDGRIIGVLGSQFTVDVGKAQGVYSEAKVVIARLKRKKNHPLLKEIVDWETENLAEAKIIHTARTQSTGKVSKYYTKKRLKVDDWIIVKKEPLKTIVEKKEYKEINSYQFGKLGTLGIVFNAGKGSATSINSSDTKKIGGVLLGVELDAQIWITRNYWGSFNLGQKFGLLKKEEGDVENDSNSESISKFDLRFGYKYLPMGFFYGPQIDGFIGYANYNFGLDTSLSDGFTEVGFEGFLMGVEGLIPVARLFRLNLELSFIFNPKYTEELNVYGASDSSSTYNIDLGGSYLYSPNMMVDFGYGVTAAKAKFRNPTRSIRVKESQLKIGTSFTF